MSVPTSRTEADRGSDRSAATSEEAGTHDTSSSARTPFNSVDQLIYHLDQHGEPWSVQCEIRVSGRLTRLAYAPRHGW